MNIIILTPTKNNHGGVERFSYYLRDELLKRGHTISLLGPEDLTPFQRSIIRIKKKFGFEQPALGYFLGRLAQKRGFDVCITNGMLGWNLKSAVNLEGKGVINVQHGTFARSAVRIDRSRNYLKYLFKRYIWGYFEGLAARRASTCVAVSEETKQSVQMYYGRNDVQVILNAVDTELFKPLGTTKIPFQGIFVGRFELAKGKEILEGIQNYLQSKGGNLIVAQTYSQDELVHFYNTSQVFLLPSLHEGCSYALLDAMACGLPFLASPVGLVPELEAKGLFSECIVHESTVDAYIQAFERLVHQSPEERKNFTEQLRLYILEHHSIKQFGDAYDALVRSLDN